MGDYGWRLQRCMILLFSLQTHLLSNARLLFIHKLCTVFLPFLVKWNAFIFNGIGFLVDSFSLGICCHVSDRDVLVQYLSIVAYYFDFSLGKVVLKPPTIRWVTRTFLNLFFDDGLKLHFCVFTRGRLWEIIVILFERLWPTFCYFWY